MEGVAVPKLPVSAEEPRAGNDCFHAISAITQDSTDDCFFVGSGLSLSSAMVRLDMNSDPDSSGMNR